ncbi:MAG: hypothetical protein D6812_11140 [Deltaproteobacteria bacterium]|nr:MAG: hypothetical protein D6812_11140 [Deltaproteobacteria bacterium]
MSRDVMGLYIPFPFRVVKKMADRFVSSPPIGIVPLKLQAVRRPEKSVLRLHVFRMETLEGIPIGERAMETNSRRSSWARGRDRDILLLLEDLEISAEGVRCIEDPQEREAQIETLFSSVKRIDTALQPRRAVLAKGTRHEVNNILLTLTGYAQVAKETKERGDIASFVAIVHPCVERLRSILRSGERAGSLVVDPKLGNA